MGVSAQTLNIEDLIPQRAPMIFVDAFDGIDDAEVSHTRLTVRADQLFVENGRLTECGLIEHMAQSAAARDGWSCRKAGREVPVGFIGAVSHFTAFRLPPAGAHLATSLRIVQQVGPVSLAEATVETAEGPVAEGRLKIFLQI